MASFRPVERQAGNNARPPRRTAKYGPGFWRPGNEHVTPVVLDAERAPLAMASRFRSPSMRFEFTIPDLAQMDQEKVVSAVERPLRRRKGRAQAGAARTFVILPGLIGIEQRTLGPITPKGPWQGCQPGRMEGVQSTDPRTIRAPCRLQRGIAAAPR